MTKTKRIPRGEYKCTPRSLWNGEAGVPVAKFMIPSFRKAINVEARSITFTISTGTKDRDGDIIEPSGWDLKFFHNNPQVLWAHEAWELPIAKAKNTKVENGRLISEAIFTTVDENPVGDKVFQLYRGGFLNAVSVGFQPMDMELIAADDPSEIGFRFTRQELMEYSAVPIPSNPEALMRDGVMRERTKGLDMDFYKGWIELILNDKAAGPDEEWLNRFFTALTNKVHPVRQDELRAKNAKTLREKDTHDDEDDDRPVLTTGAGGDDSHTHTFKAGDEMTEPGGDDGHIHAITYSDGEDVVIEGNLGHAHDAPAGAAIPDEGKSLDTAEDAHESATEDAQEPEADPEVVAPLEPEETSDGADKAAEIVLTDWPQAGMNLPVSLLTSDYRAFPLAEAKALRDGWPEIWVMAYPEVWAMGGCPGLETFTTEDAIRAREDWASRFVDGYTLEDVVKQVRCLVRGSRGIEHMRLVLSLAKEEVMNQRDKAKGLSPEEIGAITDRVVTKAVIPAIEKAFRKYTGRLS